MSPKEAKESVAAVAVASIFVRVFWTKFCHMKNCLGNIVLVFRPEKEASEDSDSSPPYLPAQPSAPEEVDHIDRQMAEPYVRDVAV